MQPLNPHTLPLAGRNLIQASAGTGKTWTISLLYVRLIVEQLLTVDQILVVTYTRAATEELRSRIRERLKEALAAYQTPEHISKHEYLQLLENYPDTAERRWYLQRALLGFDEATVFTIHGFCQRVLQEKAFEVGLPFESELVTSEADLQLALADQFWQQRLLQPNALDTAVLQQHALTPDSLLADVADFIGKPYLHAIKAVATSEADFLAAQTRSIALLARLQALWASDKNGIMQVLLIPGQLNKASYAEDKLQHAVAVLEAFLGGKSDKDSRRELAKFTPDMLTRKTNKNKTTPEHAFFELMADFLQTDEALGNLHEQALDQLRYDLLLWLREQLPERKRQAGILAFDDLLVNLQEALATRPGLAAQLAGQYKVALIDEFQDTDPVQYRVFEQIYRDSEGQVYYVGDPKQAIYSFRGADIYTYLQAATGVNSGQQYTLDRNFRSHERLIHAFNHLYAQSADPFRNQRRIDYERVKAGGSVSETLRSTPAIAPLRIWDWQGGQGDGETPGLASVQTQIALAVADDIARLLQEGQQGIALIGERPVVSGDFAVLVRSHRHGRLIKEALQTRSIASVQKSPLGIFQTHEASELRLILAAIAEPGDIGKVRRALVTELMGGTAQMLLNMDSDQQQFDAQLEDVYRWHQQWQKQGFMHMLRAWMQDRDVRRRLLSHVDGERRLTNLLHLAELIHTETRKQWHGMQAILRWLRSRAAGRSEEEHQLRLESDENLVQIVTIHKSKGLQYPVVYCPFLWNENEKAPTQHWFVWHDGNTGQSCLQAGREGLEQARARRLEEDRSENLRLLYVALTRAQYQCTVAIASGEISRHTYGSALNWLLFGHLPDSDKLLGSKTTMAPDQRQTGMQQALRDLADSSAGTISCEPLPPADATVRFHARKQAPTDLQARTFQTRIPPVQRIGSFSGLTSGRHDERPDYDHGFSIELQTPARSTNRDLGQFPGGKRAGVCLHKMFERADFQQPLAEQAAEVIDKSLQEQGYGQEWRPAAEHLLDACINTPLLPPGKKLRLARIGKDDRLDEMEFYFPVQRLRVDLLQQILLYYLPDDWQAIRTAVQGLRFSDLQGYMKGYIDLVFRADGQYYIVDYKSNWLGDRPADYQTPVLHQAMADAHYYLQYLIYCVAVHRFLQKRLQGYRWETHIGGVLYLFLRGMGTDADHPQNGIFFHKPSVELIDALDGLMEFIQEKSLSEDG